MNPVKTTQVMIATPSIDGKLDYRYVASLMRTTGLLTERGIGYTLGLEVGNSLVADARNQLVSAFMASDCTDLFFIDADMAWQSEDFWAVLQAPHPVAAAAYLRKSDSPDFTVKFGAEIRSEDGWVAVDRVGTGFLRLRRQCIETLMRCHPNLQLKSKKRPGDPHLYLFFDTGVVDGAFVGEDYMFCDRWRATGGDIMVNPNVSLQHVGTRVWEGKLSDHLKRSN